MNPQYSSRCISSPPCRSCGPCTFSVSPPTRMYVLMLLFQQLNDDHASGGRGGGRGAANIRAVCRRLRDAFDSCNTRLVLGGARPPITVSFTPNVLQGARKPPRGNKLGVKSPPPEHRWACDRRARLALFKNLIERTPCLVSLRIREWFVGKDLAHLGLP